MNNTNTNINTDTKAMSLTEALRDGVTLDEIRESFEASLQKAQDEVNAEKAAAAAKEHEKECCGKCKCDGDSHLDICREELIYDIIEYFIALGVISKDEFDDEDINKITDAIKEVEEQLKLEINFAKMLGKFVADSVAEKDNKKAEDTKKEKEQVLTPKNATATVKMEGKRPSSDDIIAMFLKSLS